MKLFLFLASPPRPSLYFQTNEINWKPQTSSKAPRQVGCQTNATLPKLRRIPPTLPPAPLLRASPPTRGCVLQTQEVLKF